MNQSSFAEKVLERRRVPAAASRRYISVEQAEAILDETIDYVGRHEDAVTYKYLLGHRKRLVETLVRIPCADKPDAACLDVGCFGYMAFWRGGTWGIAGWRASSSVPTSRRPSRCAS